MEYFQTVYNQEMLSERIFWPYKVPTKLTDFCLHIVSNSDYIYFSLKKNLSYGPELCQLTFDWTPLLAYEAWWSIAHKKLKRVDSDEYFLKS